MSQTEITRAPDPTTPFMQKPGTWYPIIVMEGGRRRKSARMSCPDCGLSGTLSDHTIHVTGLVEPSVLCECGYHEVGVTLQNWEP